MSKVRFINGIQHKGQLGGVVFNKFRGIDVARSNNTEPSNPRTILQVTQRNKFAVVVFIAKSLLALIRFSFKELEDVKSGYNIFTSKNVAIMDGNTGFVPLNKLSDLVVSQGTLEPITRAITVTNNSGEVSGTIDTTQFTANANGADNLNIVIVDATNQTARYILDNATRSEGTFSFAFTDEEAASYNAGNLGLYFFYTSPDMKKNSDAYVYMN